MNTSKQSIMTATLSPNEIRKHSGIVCLVCGRSGHKMRSEVDIHNCHPEEVGHIITCTVLSTYYLHTIHTYVSIYYLHTIYTYQCIKQLNVIQQRPGEVDPHILGQQVHASQGFQFPCCCFPHHGQIDPLCHISCRQLADSSADLDYWSQEWVGEQQQMQSYQQWRIFSYRVEL